jgi:hypothetical protein
MFGSLKYQADMKGIVAPEIVIADTAHPAYRKAASYSGARHVPQSGVVFIAAPGRRRVLHSSFRVPVFRMTHRTNRNICGSTAKRWQ